MSILRTLRLILGVMLAAACAGASAAPTHLVFTADTQGHVGPCESCPGAHGLGSLARRQTLLTKLRAREPGLLLLDAGDALFGDESTPSGGKVIAAAYDALGYDAANITYRDFRLGKAATLAVLQGAKFVPLSANLLDAATGQLLFRPYVVKQVGGERIAVVGATESPVALAMLPELSRQLAGVKIQPPAEALAAILPKARAQASRVVLLFYGSTVGVALIRKQFGRSIDVILVGGAQPGEIPTGGEPPLFATFSHGRQVADVTLAVGQPPQVTQWAVVGGFVPDPAMQKLVSAYPTGTAPINLAATPATAGAIAGPATRGLDRIDPGKTEPFNSSGRNSAVELTVKSVALLDKLGDSAAPDGKLLLVIDAQLRNLQPAQLVNAKSTLAQYQVPNLADNLYGVADESRVLPRASIDEGGLLPFGPITLQKQNDAIEGNIVYQVPKVAVPRDVKLRFYDFAHGNIVVPVLSGPFEQAKPLAPPLHNEVVEAAIYGVKKVMALNGRPAPAGRTFVLIDLRARSTMVTRADASAFDFHAKPGEKLDVGTVADWKESRKYAQLVADGQYAYAPLAESSLPQEPRFLPDVMTGGTLVFLVPEKHQSIELRCDFPNASLTDGKVVRPPGLTLPLEGVRPTLAEPPALAEARDAVFDVRVVGEQASGEFAGVKAGEGRQFLALTFTVKNIGAQQEFFVPKEQLKYVTEAGEQIALDDASLQGPTPPGEQMYVPAGEHRTFTAAYRVGSDQTRPRLAYAAVTEGAAKILMLKPLTHPAAVAVAPQSPQPPTPPTPAPTPASANPVPPTPAPTQMPANPAPTTPAPTPTPSNPAVKPTVPANPPPAAAPMRPALPAAQSPAALPAAVTAGPQPRPHGPARGIAGVGLTAEQVNLTIDNGARGLWKFLKTHDLKDGTDTFGDNETHVLCALALVHADAQRKIPEFDAALRGFLARVDPPTIRSHSVYREALLCMLIQAYGDPSFEPKLRQAARWLLESHLKDGTWTYDADLPASLFAQAAGTQALQITGGLPPDVKAQPWKRLTPWGKDANGDNSCTQYALLGLQAAAASGVPIPDDPWKRALAVMKQRQGDTGGWEYHEASGDGGYGSMTASGVCSAAICLEETGDKNFAAEPVVRHGLAWIDANFSVDSHPKYSDGSEYLYYWLYSLERVGRFLDTDFIGQNEWYPRRAAFLVHRQQAGGLWVGKDDEQDPRLATSFALLFLTRATPPLKPVEQHGPGFVHTAVVAADNRFYIILDASGSMLDTMDGRMKFDIARGAVQSLIDALPPNSQVALRVYGHRKSALDPGCDLDTELKISMAPLDKKQFAASLASLRSRGKTPLALSIEDAIKDLGDVSEKSPVTLLLLTDGGEDTIRPRGDPIQAARDLAKVKNVRFHIVGFDINEPAWSQQLLAMASGGRYWPAAKAADLERGVRDAVLGIPDRFTILDAAGRAVAAGAFGTSASLPPGQYRFQTDFAGRPFEQTFYVNSAEVTSVTFDASHAPPGVATPSVASPPAAEASGLVWPKFCPHCGAPLKPGQKFCTHCGAKVVPLKQ